MTRVVRTWQSRVCSRVRLPQSPPRTPYAPLVPLACSEKLQTALSVSRQVVVTILDDGVPDQPE